LVTQEAGPKFSIRISPLDVVWSEYRDLVEAELKNMLDIDTVDFSNQEVFQKRLPAAKIVLNNMNAGQQEEIYAKVEQYKETGLPKERQRQ
jgi:hypothetical protein